MISCTPSATPAFIVAAVRATDAVTLLVLLAFIWWGARKGALRQALSLLVLGAAFWAAGALAGTVEPTIAKLFQLEADERLALAWATVLFGALVAGGLLLRLLASGLAQRSHGGADRLLGGLLGATKGVVVLTVVGYAVLAFGGPAAGPALSRPADPAATGDQEPSRDLGERVRGSLSAVCLTEWGGLLRRCITVPAWIDRRVEDVNRRIRPGPRDGGPDGRPRVR